MNQGYIIDIMRNAIWSVILVAAPPLLLGLTVGIIVSIFQAVTSIQEPTLAFVPKIIAVLLSLVIFGFFMLNTLQDYVLQLYASIPEYIKSYK